MPRLLQEHRKLAALAGSWTGVERIHPSPWDPQGGVAKARVESRVACDGFCVVTDYVEERNGAVSYLGHGVTGFDPTLGRYLQHWTDSAGGMPAQAKSGTWDGDTLTFHGAGPAGRVRYVYLFVSPDVYELRVENSPDGAAWTSFLEGRYSRVLAAPLEREVRRRPAGKKRPARKAAKRVKKRPKAKRKAR
ncbi:MAG: DUF1579 family protein [Planctomycetota bacterium]